MRRSPYAAGDAVSLSVIALTTATLAGLIFAIDTLSRAPFAIAVLYILVIWVAAYSRRSRWIKWTFTACVTLTLVSYWTVHGAHANADPLVRCLVSLAAISLGYLHTLNSISAIAILREQARLLDQTHDSVTVRSLDGIITYWNHGAELLYGWQHAEAVGSPSISLLKSRFPIQLQDIEIQIRTLGFWEGEIVNLSKNGTERIVHSRLSELRDDEGNAISILETSNDITSRKSSTERLEKSETRYRNIFQTSGVSIWECDFSAIKRLIDERIRPGATDIREFMTSHPEFIKENISVSTITDVNNASIELFGALSKDELIGPIGTLWPPEAEDIFAESVIAAVTNVSSFESEVTLRTVTGQPITCLYKISFPAESRSRESVFIVLTDVTSRNEAQAALHVAQADLAHASRLQGLGELTASIAHEVNQPLTSIVTHAQAGLRWLKRPIPEVSVAATSLEKIVIQAKRASAVIASVQALSRKEERPETQVNLNDIVKDSIALMSHEFKREGIELKLRLSPILMPVTVDHVKAQQVIINLILNAVQAMSAVDNRSRHISVETRLSETAVVLSVEDTGPGISEDLRDRLFTAFVTTKTDGMGMGLSICRSIIEQAGGRIWAENREGYGARFSLTLPFSPVSEALFANV